MTRTPTLKDVLDWAVTQKEAAESIRCLTKVPSRLALIDADLAALPASLDDFDRHVVGKGYAMVGSPKNIDENGRRMDARIRALLKRFWLAYVGVEANESNVRQRWTDLIAAIEAEEGKPGSGKRWNIGRSRSFTIFRARSILSPEAMSQEEIDRIGLEVSADKRKGLRKSVGFLNALEALAIQLPALAPFVPAQKFAPPAGSARARMIDWQSSPEPFRASFEAAADTCLGSSDTLAEELLARIEAGEDPEVVVAEADFLGQDVSDTVGKPTLARNMYRQGVIWLLRAFEDHGGDPATLTDIRALFTRPIIEAAIKDQIQRSKLGRDLKDPLSSTTLPARLTSLTTLAKRGLQDPAAVGVLKVLGMAHYDRPRAKLKRSKEDSGAEMAVDTLFDLIRQRPELLALWGDAPRRIAEQAREQIAKARVEEHLGREITGLRLFAGAVAFAIQLSRPMRTACLRNARIEAAGDAHNNLLRTAPGQKMFTFRFAPWEIKNSRWINVDVVDHDAEVLREWIDVWRPRTLAIKGIESVYLFPGEATPEHDDGNPFNLPKGCFATSSFLEVWRDAARVVGFVATPHRMRHFVALSILSSNPGNYAKVASVLGNTEQVCRKHYGRDDGQAAARESRAAMVAQHPDIFRQLKKRHARDQ